LKAKSKLNQSSIKAQSKLNQSSIKAQSNTTLNCMWSFFYMTLKETNCWQHV